MIILLLNLTRPRMYIVAFSLELLILIFYVAIIVLLVPILYRA